MTPEEHDLDARCAHANEVLEQMAADMAAIGNPERAAHLASKAEGVRLAQSYLHEHVRVRQNARSTTTREDLMSTDTSTPEVGTLVSESFLGRDEREAALDYAVRFHSNAGSDDPNTVVETAETFWAFLTGNGARGKHEAR